MSANSYVDTLGNALVSAKIGLRNKADLIGPLDLLQWGKQVQHDLNSDTDTFRVEYYKELFDHDTAGNQPVPLVSRRLGTDGASGTPLVAQNAYVERQLGMYANHLIITDATRKMSGDKVLETYQKKLVSLAVSDIGKLGFRTFDGLDGTSFVRFGKAAATGESAETACAAEISQYDIREAFSRFRDYHVQPIVDIQDAKNNFSLTQIQPSYVLLIHPAVVIDMLENFTGTYEFIHISQYGANGIKPIGQREIGIIPKYDCRVIVSDFVKAQTGVATAGTAGLRQSGGTNITYHNILLGAEAYAMPGLGRMIDAKVTLENGKQERITKLSGVDFWSFSPQHSAADPQGLKHGLGYQFWCGDTANAEGGILLPSVTSGGTTVYKAHKIITCAST